MNSRTIVNQVSGNIQIFQTLILAGAFLALMVISSPTFADSEISVPTGDVAGFISAIQEANQASDTTIIHLAGGIPYEFNLTQSSPEPITSHIVLVGDGAEFVGEGDENYGRLFEISEEGYLEVLDLIIRDFTGDQETSEGLIFNSGSLRMRDVRIESMTSRISRAQAGIGFGGALIENSGDLVLDRVRITDVVLNVFGNNPGDGAFAVIALVNKGPGDAVLQNVLIADGRATDPALARPFGTYIYQNYYLNGAGGLAALNLEFSTLIRQTNGSGLATDVEGISRACVRPQACAPVFSTASMFLGVPCPLVHLGGSGGFNLADDGNCQGTMSSDLIGVSPGTLAYEHDAEGGIRVVLPLFSPAVDSVHNPEISCGSRDAGRARRPADGNYDGTIRCDIGAFERQAGRAIFSGGENGTYYSAGADGHYVTIEEVRPHEYVVFWNTFDLDGNQAWVLAVGERSGDRIVADAYFQPEGTLIPGGGADVNTDAMQDWGGIVVTVNDCLGGRFQYDSALAQFGSGSFNLNRLGFNHRLGCQD